MIHPRIAIIDGSLSAIRELKTELERYNQFEVVGHAQTKTDAIKLIKNEKPEIVFLDVFLENESISGFELLNELKDSKKNGFVTIFYTANDKYVIQAIRASAFDYLLKPVDPLQLAIVISRLQTIMVDENKTNVEKYIDQICLSPKIGLQTVKGIRFVKLQTIVFIHLEKSPVNGGSQVMVNLIDGEKIKLTSNVTLKKIRSIIADENFFEISRQSIVNLNYLYEVENGERNICTLCAPYENVQLKISRNQMQELRKRFCLV